MNRFPCPGCGLESVIGAAGVCRNCSTDLRMSAETIAASFESIELAVLALAESRDRDAHDFALESWSLFHSRLAASAGLIAAVLMKDPIDIARWLRRRKRIQEAGPQEMP